MIKKLPLFLVFTFFICLQIDAQVTIFSEDFEAATGAENIASPYLNWQNGQFTTTPPTNNNYFWVFDNTRCNVLNGTHSMAVSINNPVTSGTLPEYRTTRNASTLVYHTNPIDATNHTNLTLDFNWICEGELLFDYGTVLYSLDALNWSTLPGTYEGQSTIQNVTNLDLSVLDGQIFYLAFGWNNDGSLGSFPGFIVDDIDVKGTPLPACTVPVQPTVLNLTPTNNTIIGTFTAAAPASDNYLVVVSTNPVAPTPANGTAYNIGDTIGTGTVVDIDTNISFTATGLTANTLYYIYVYSYNSLCSGGPIYNTTSPLSGSATTTNSSYCLPITQNAPATLYIEDVQFLGTLNDVNNLTNGFSAAPSGYQDFTGSVANSIQAQGQGINIFVGSNLARGHYKAWVDWDNDGVFNNTTELVYDSGGVLTATTTFGFVIPANQTIGDYRIRIRFNNAYNDRFGTELGSYDYTACEPFINHDFPGQNNDYTDYGEAEDYLFTVVESCSAQITSITDGIACGPGSTTLQVTGNAAASDFNWYTNETGGSPIATSATFTPVISATTTYWVTATDGSCESLKRIPVTATLNPITELTITPATPIICGENDIIEIAATGSIEIAYLIDEDFESGGTGVFNVVNVFNNTPAEDALTEWQNRTSTFVPNQQVWYPAISSGFGTNQFVMATSDIAPSTGVVWTSLESPILDSSIFTDLTLNFDMYFSKYSATSSPDNVYVWVSTDGGANYNVLQNIAADVGIGTNFGTVNIDMTAYINETNLRIAIDYIAGWMDGVAIDNIQLFGSRPLNPSFTWTGTVDAYLDAATMNPYTPGTPTASVFIKPTLAQLSQPTFTFTANATLSNGCIVNKDITITNNTKIWQGGQDWDNANNWLPIGVPTADDCVIIDSNSFLPHNRPGIPPTLYEAFAKNVNIKNGGNLEIVSTNNLTVTEWINIDGTLDVNDDASLIQIDNVPNTGTGLANVNRITPNGLDILDYTYWSSAVTSPSNFTLNDLSPNTPGGLHYIWQATVAGNSGNWVAVDANTTVMEPGKGYISRAPSDIANTGTYPNNAFSGKFEGIPNNGNILSPIAIGTLPVSDDDNWNLIGNPYPSAIDIVDFLDHLNNIPLIDGTIYLWTRNSPPLAATPDPFYGNFGLNYTENDYASVNYMASTVTSTDALSGGQSPSQNIASGQAFFVRGLSNGNVLFDNDMRIKNNNDNFFRNANNQTSNFEKHRFWLNLSDNSGGFSQIVIGYAEGATLGWDRGLDGLAFSGNAVTFYSVTDDNLLTIQGRPLPFTDTDIVPVGFIAITQNTYEIGIDHLDELFENQTIYLEDTYTETLHDLKIAPYTFTSESGTFDDRFILRYTSNLLNVKGFDSVSGIKIFEESDELVVKSDYENIESIEVYDILGRTLFFDKAINTNRFIIKLLQPKDTVLFLKIKLVDGKQKIVKIIF